MSAYNVKAHPAFAGYELSEANGTFGGGFRRALAGIAAWRRSRSVYNRTFNELEALSGRELADIGITRYDIPFIAADAAKTARRA
jgi:uncharacterized protein YjiS (DUF1127 family)